MIRTKDYEQTSEGTRPAAEQSTAARLCAELETEGIVVLPSLLTDEQLRGMQQAFATKLRRLRWNNFDGYQKTELYRHMVEDVLLLDQGFVDLAIHPLLKQILNLYLGDTYELTEAKGWKSLPTKRDFHGWHGDAWYDQKTIQDIPREVKLAFYLTDVRSGAFNYVRRSQRRQHPRPVRNPEVENFPASQILEVAGRAGSAFLFDTSGIHRQGVPMLEPRRAVFYNYHDPSVALQKEDVDYYRYHPLLLNAAFLGDLTAEDHRILGFGNKKNFIPAFERIISPPALHNFFGAALNVQLRVSNLRERIVAKLRHVFGQS
ncbi:MAG: uncharacterized protein JWM21_2403 [Acidobacteria bacterium]|nr:uncharacterized protein [Acidobacteriota bacterium]